MIVEVKTNTAKNWLSLEILKNSLCTMSQSTVLKYCFDRTKIRFKFNLRQGGSGCSSTIYSEEGCRISAEDFFFLRG